MLTLSDLFTQLPPSIQGKPSLSFLLCLPSGNFLQTSELLAVFLFLTDIHLNALTCGVLPRKANVLHSLSLSLKWELRSSCGIWPILWTTIFLDLLNLKYVTLWMTSSLLYLSYPGWGLYSWNSSIEIDVFMKKKKPWTHPLFYNTVKSSNWQKLTLKSFIHPNTQHCWSSTVWCLPTEAGYCTHQSCLFGTLLGVSSHFFLTVFSFFLFTLRSYFLKTDFIWCQLMKNTKLLCLITKAPGCKM